MVSSTLRGFSPNKNNTQDGLRTENEGVWRASIGRAECWSSQNTNGGCQNSNRVSRRAHCRHQVHGGTEEHNFGWCQSSRIYPCLHAVVSSGQQDIDWLLWGFKRKPQSEQGQQVCKARTGLCRQHELDTHNSVLLVLQDKEDKSDESNRSTNKDYETSRAHRQ